MNNIPPQKVMLAANRHTLIVMLICYFPHFFTAPWWLFLLVLIAIGYRLLADYFAYPLLNLWIRIGLVIACLVLLKMHYGSIISNGFFIGFLLTFIALKCVEIHTPRDLKVMVFCNFYLIFSALIVIQELWIVVYLLLAILANFTLMLRLNAPKASLRQIGGKSGQLLLIAIPLSVILFYIFPRISNPLWQVPAINESQVGFSERMSFGSIAQLFHDNSTAMRITFNDKPILNGYWRGLILSFYNGVSWNPGGNNNDFHRLEELDATDPGDYEVIVEPHQKKWLFYLHEPIAGRPSLSYSPNSGLISQANDIIEQRFDYIVKVKASPYRELTPQETVQFTELPQKINPRLEAWSKAQYAKVQHNPQAFVHFLHQYIHQLPFWYTLTAPQLSGKNQMDEFWFDTRKGFCEHYASAVTVILRQVGIPARVVVGYQGGDWNPLAHYLELQQNDAHAWIEYWQKDKGWEQLDPTIFIALERREQSIRDMQENRSNEVAYLSSLSWIQHLKFFIQSSRFFAERWFLFYNQDTQHDLLAKTGFGKWNLGQLLQLVIISLIVFFILYGIIYEWWHKRMQDPLLIEYHLLQKQFKRFNVPVHPSATLKQQCKSLIDNAPQLASVLSSFLHLYEQLRLKPTDKIPKENTHQTLVLFKSLRKKLAKSSPSKPFKKINN